jgi:hypothetical protein
MLETDLDARIHMRRHGGPPRPRRIAGRFVQTLLTATLVAGLTPGAVVASAASSHRPEPAAQQAESLWGLGVSNAAVDPDGLQRSMGRTFQAIGIYAPLTGTSYPTSSARRSAQDGADVYVNINSWRLVGGKKVCYRFADYPSHTYDAYLQRWVDDLRAFDYDRTYLTFTHEPTVTRDAQPGCGTPADYVKAYDYVVRYFRSHGVTYPFVWWMVASSFIQGHARDWQPPATDFSVVGVDGYNRFLRGVWRTPEYIFTASRDYAQQLGKPLLVGEVGSVEDPRDANRKGDWLTDASGLFRSWGVDAILWNDQEQYRPDSSATSLSAWVDASQAAGSSFLANAYGNPGSTASTWAAGFTPGETVDVRLDSASGTVLASDAADANGAVNPMTLQLPTPLPGGDHSIVAVGHTSGNVATGALSITPPDSPAFNIAAGDTYTYHGVGFVPGETVSVTFPGGSPVTEVADATGSVDIPAVSPPEPHDGGRLTVTADSASVGIFFRGRPVVGQIAGQPKDTVPVSVTGFNATENVAVKIDGVVGTRLTTDRTGSASGLLVLDATFGSHVIDFVGAKSGVVRSRSIHMKADMTLSPNTGPRGATTRITSGPGWAKGEIVQVRVGGTVVRTVTANARGRVSTSVTIDRKPGVVRVTLTGLTLRLTARADFTVV